MKKILMVFHPLMNVEEEQSLNGIAPHHLWCYDSLKNAGYKVDVLKTYTGSNIINKIGEKIGVNFLQQQIDCLKKAKDYDLIFIPFIEFSFVIAFLKILRFFRKPVIAITHYAYEIPKGKFLRKIKALGIRFVYFKGTDQIIFYNKPLINKSVEQFIKGRSVLIDSWGVDNDFFEAFSKSQINTPTSDYVYSTGGSFRDFTTLINAFYDIDFNLKITTAGNSKILRHPINPNIEIEYLPFGSTSLIRDAYYNSMAVAIPLKKAPRLDTSGITVLMEGMAMGKPIITTYNEAYPFDVEKEKVGLNVGYGDSRGWKDAINYLIENPTLAKEMGKRGQNLVKNRYNYQLFSKELTKLIPNWLPDITLVKKNDVLNKRKSLELSATPLSNESI